MLICWQISVEKATKAFQQQLDTVKQKMKAFSVASFRALLVKIKTTLE